MEKVGENKVSFKLMDDNYIVEFGIVKGPIVYNNDSTLFEILSYGKPELYELPFTVSLQEKASFLKVKRDLNIGNHENYDHLFDIHYVEGFTPYIIEKKQADKGTVKLHMEMAVEILKHNELREMLDELLRAAKFSAYPKKIDS